MWLKLRDGAAAQDKGVAGIQGSKGSCDSKLHEELWLKVPWGVMAQSSGEVVVQEQGELTLAIGTTYDSLLMHVSTL
jgi:hypothetical protein